MITVQVYMMREGYCLSKFNKNCLIYKGKFVNVYKTSLNWWLIFDFMLTNRWRSGKLFSAREIWYIINYIKEIIMKTYSVSVQFANPNAPDFHQIIDLIVDGIEYYNQRSLIATNPKRIIDYKVIDPHTMELVLESEAELPYPSKALQTLSRYLVDGSLNRFIYGKQLFKMSSKEVVTTEQLQNNMLNNNNSVEFLKLKVISFVLTASEKELNSILEILKGEVQ